MAYLLTLQAASGAPAVRLRLPEDLVAAPAIEAIMALAAPVDDLIAEGWLDPADATGMAALQARLFDRDEEGPFVREGIDLHGPQGSLDPDRPLQPVFATDSRGEIALTITLHADDGDEPAGDGDQDLAEQMTQFQMLFLRHYLAKGGYLDVTKDDPFIKEALTRLERARELEIDVERAAWKLSPAGHGAWERQRQEALDLIRRYDIFGDVDARFGEPKFGTGLGDDWRVPAYEADGVDAFRARFLLGLNDGEWDNLPDWREKIASPAWYDEIFAPVSSAPTVEEIGEAKLAQVLEAGTREIRAILEEEHRLGIDPNNDRIPNPYRDGTLEGW